MGKSLRMRVVAEGVETDGQACLLEQLRCDELQGYLIARPMGADDVTAFLERAETSQRDADVVPAAVQASA